MVEINLLPWRKELRLKKERSFKNQVLIIFVIAVLILSLWHALLERQINIVRKQTNHLQQQLFLFKELPRNTSKAKHQQQLLQQTIDKIINLEMQRVELVRVFENLHHGIITGTHLTQLLIKNGGIRLSGKAESIAGVTHLIKNITQMNCYGSIPSVQKISNQNEGYDFTLGLGSKL